jgi:hypothetical protein
MVSSTRERAGSARPDSVASVMIFSIVRHAAVRHLGCRIVKQGRTGDPAADIFRQ